MHPGLTVLLVLVGGLVAALGITLIFSRSTNKSEHSGAGGLPEDITE